MENIILYRINKYPQNDINIRVPVAAGIYSNVFNSILYRFIENLPFIPNIILVPKLCG